ncbi:hypothetical protein ACQ86E_20730 [Bradyrhizobium betae]|uniref:hypothetical protein n=1 Tax=Bradyrhizobium betae TaxID=244734 RepID=UPI003D67E37F
MDAPVKPWIRLEFKRAAADFGVLVAKARPDSNMLKAIVVLSVAPINEDFADVVILVNPDLVDEWRAVATDVDMKHLAHFECLQEAVNICEDREKRRGQLRPRL